METGMKKGTGLTPAQRYFFDVSGYVLLKSVFSPAECGRLIDLADRMDADDGCAYKHDGYPKTPALTVLSRCAWYHPHLLETAMHPVLLPIMQDVVGGDVRLEEHQYLINYPVELERDTAFNDSRVADEGWHRGIAPNFGSFEADGHYHCMFSKAFIYLTDNGPGEGTWVVPGSHRMDMPMATLREIHGRDPGAATGIPGRRRAHPERNAHPRRSPIETRARRPGIRWSTGIRRRSCRRGIATIRRLTCSSG